MMSEKDLMRRAAEEFIKVFGRKYLQDTYHDSCLAYGLINNGDTYWVFTGIKGSKDLPNRKANDKGWVVYGQVWLDAHTGEMKKIDYVLE